MADQQEQQPNVRKNEKVGTVVSAKMAKTIVVEGHPPGAAPGVQAESSVAAKKFYAHDEASTAKMGDTVRIVEHRPLSKLKRWALADIIRRAVQVGVEPEQVDPAAEAQTGAGGKKRRKSKHHTGTETDSKV
jgi:small subunit ribosomal protein S17